MGKITCTYISEMFNVEVAQVKCCLAGLPLVFSVYPFIGLDSFKLIHLYTLSSFDVLKATDSAEILS